MVISLSVSMRLSWSFFLLERAPLSLSLCRTMLMIRSAVPFPRPSLTLFSLVFYWQNYHWIAFPWHNPDLNSNICFNWQQLHTFKVQRSIYVFTITRLKAHGKTHWALITHISFSWSIFASKHVYFIPVSPSNSHQQIWQMAYPCSYKIPGKPSFIVCFPWAKIIPGMPWPAKCRSTCTLSTRSILVDIQPG
jgi:hypothetical protein